MKRILAISPHPDDVELGCFGTLCRLADEGNEIHILVLTQGEGGTTNGNRLEEASQSAKLLQCTLHSEYLRDRYISEGPETISIIEKYVHDIEPDIMFIPSKNDTHQDHRATHLASIVAARNTSEIYIYQSPSTTIDFYPNYYVDISAYIHTKIEAIKIHLSQSDKVYMAERAIMGLAEYRAFDVLRNNSFFEAFETYRVIK